MATCTVSNNSTGLASRPRFHNVIRPSESILLDEEKLRRFEIWKKKNAEWMKRANVKAKVYEFSRPPRIMGDPRLSKSASQLSRTTVKKKLITASTSNLVKTPDLPKRRKRYRKVRHRSSSSRVSKAPGTSSDDDDSGLSLFKSDTSIDTATESRGKKKARPVPRPKKKVSFEESLKELISEVIDHSICEVSMEERHMMTLSTTNHQIPVM